MSASLNASLSWLTYGQFLATFLLPPIAGLSFLVLRDHRRRSSNGKGRQRVVQWWLLAGLVVVAIVYTIPWDNHLIAQGVWSYDPSRVSGITLGRIPLEEVLFFPLQTFLVGQWVLWLTPRLLPGRHDTCGVALEKVRESVRADNSRTAGTAMLVYPHERARYDVAPIIRCIGVTVVGMAWLVALVVLVRGWRPGTYLGWELVWSLPPLALQLGLGADLLWRRRRLVLAALIPIAVYLSMADALAIYAGIWVISPRLSLGVLLGGVLPLEELVFFLLTSALVVGGLVVGGDVEAGVRLRLRGIHRQIERKAIHEMNSGSRLGRSRGDNASLG